MPDSNTPPEVLWLYEHVARELDVACAISTRLKMQGATTQIQNFYQKLPKLLKKWSSGPKVVVLPFFYRHSDQGISEMIKHWKTTHFFNLTYEQLLSEHNIKVRMPKDEFSKTQVLHHAWSNDYATHLKNAGVGHSQIFINGSPVLQLYQKGYQNFFLTRDELSEKHQLDPKKRWIFVIENFKWAFFKDNRLKAMATQGGVPLKQFLEVREYCLNSLALLLKELSEIAKHSDCEIIFRPRPQVHSSVFSSFLQSRVGPLAPELHLVRDGSVREWILASDRKVSAYSTTLIEASVAGKPGAFYEVPGAPLGFSIEWANLTRRISGQKELERFIHAPDSEVQSYSRELGDWAKSRFLAHGDPLIGIESKILELLKTPVDTNKRNQVLKNLEFPTISISLIAKRWLRKWIPSRNEHEMDFLTDQELKIRERLWTHWLNQTTS